MAIISPSGDENGAAPAERIGFLARLKRAFVWIKQATLGLFAPDEPLSLTAVLAEEFRVVHSDGLAFGDASHSLADIQRQHYERQTAALCLSGGGIRSAAFGFGVIQALARVGLLKRFHYLSTVSGGGYTGGFLSTWIYRARGGVKEVEQTLNQRGPAETEPGGKHNPVHWLRRYSSYLSPRLGILSLDTWTLGVTYVRNLLLNWLVLLPALGVMVCGPMLVAALITDSFWWRDEETPKWAQGTGFATTLLALFLLRWRTYSTGSDAIRRWVTRLLPGWLQRKLTGWLPGLHAVIVGLMLVGAVLVTATVYVRLDPSDNPLVGDESVVMVVAISISAVLPLAFLVLDLFRTRRRPIFDRTLLVGAFAFTMLLTVFGISFWLDLIPKLSVLLQETKVEHLRDKLFLILLPPAGLALLMLPEIVFVGLAGTLSDDQDREWWARTVASVLRICALWVGASVVVLLSPDTLKWVVDHHDWLYASILAPAVSLLLGAFVARRGFVRAFTEPAPDTAGKTSFFSRIGDLGLNALGGVLIVLLFAGLATGLESGLEWHFGKSVEQGRQIPYVFTWVLTLAAFLGALAALFGFFVHINRFSLHSMYRDRLVRTFLAASRWRRDVPADLQETLLKEEDRQFHDRTADPFTDFDRDDNPLLQSLAPDRRKSRGLFGEEVDGKQAEGAPIVRAPLLVVNCALNLVGERDTALQERKADSFAFTPLHSGSATTHYRPTRRYGGLDGVSVGTAMTISGAAVSPNAGFRSTSVMTFLMTFFNARLGWWLGNPKSAASSSQTGPRFSVVPILCEMFGHTDSRGQWIYLSDGGHFDNLGVYEMVRRGCRYILVADASADPDRGFDDLGNMIRKVRIDLGIEIERLGEFQVGARDLGLRGRYAALFRISYPHCSKVEEPGLLLYLKPSVYRLTPTGAPIDVVEYGSRSGTFPHEPTSDQFYMESQLESYRALGEHEMGAVMIGNRIPENVREIFDTAMDHIKTGFPGVH